MMGLGTRMPANAKSPAGRAQSPRYRLRTLGRDRGGVVAVLAALMIVPLLALIALAIDFASVADAKAKLTVAADAAALGAVMKASQDAGMNPNASMVPAQNSGVQQFKAQIGAVTSVTLDTVAVAIARDSSTFTATVTYSGSYSSFFGSLMSAANLNVSGHTKAVVTTGPYVDIQIMLDVSSSMLIAGTPTDIANMSALTMPNMLSSFNIPKPILDAGWWANPNGCAFACHWDGSGKDFYGVSRANNITLRLDQLKSAIQTIGTTVAAKNTQNLYRLGLYSFEQSLKEEAALTANAASVATAGANVDPPQWPAMAMGHDTNITEALYSMASSYVTQGGSGTTQSTARKFVFLMTDGVEDVDNGAGGRTETPVNPAACAAIKAKGATLVVLHTQYYNPNDVFSEIKLIQPQVAANLQACASDNTLYFPVDTPAELNAAVQAMLNQALAKPAVLTQ